ncbi:MAG: HD domain-containing protein [Deltaproteobacteria bacterium]|nr:HD domain-containing protein [Deltaproteobacteria bacterium]
MTRDGLPAHLLGALEDAARRACEGAEPAHDLSHVLRVRANALRIAASEAVRVEVVEAAALLHELFNYPKNHPESHRSGEVCAHKARELLLAQAEFPVELVEPICDCIRDHAFSRGVIPTSLEGRVLQDADRLDAIGAIGVARCFATCSTMGRPFYEPSDPFCRSREPEDKLWGVDHFYRKLLRIPEGLHTSAAREMATERTRFMREFLGQLEREVGGLG